MDKISKETAEILLEIDAISIKPKDPFRYTSGILSPIYIDNRLVMSYPKAREKIIDFYIEIIKEKIKVKNIELLSGTATTAIPHAAFVAQRLGLPMVYVRDTRKGHGKENQIEGIVKRNQKAVIVEDHISTGGSAIGNVKAIREAGGRVRYALATTTYLFRRAEENFREIRLRVFTLTNFKDIIEVAIKKDLVDKEDREMILGWAEDSKGWGKKMGFE